MKNFTYRLKSKKAYTLVELIVTIAILAITAGFGIGIFASALRNYSTASITAKEQETALAIESNLLRFSRVASDLFFIDATYASTPEDSIPDNFKGTVDQVKAVKAMSGAYKNCFFIYHPYNDIDNSDNNMKVQVYNSWLPSVDGTEPPEDGVVITYSGVSKIIMTIKKYRTATGDNANSQVYLFYEIVMDSGYTLKGNTCMYGNSTAKTAVDGTGSGEDLVETSDSFVIFADDSLNTYPVKKSAGLGVTFKDYADTYSLSG